VYCIDCSKFTLQEPWCDDEVMCVQGVVPWRKSRSILYWRLRRLLLGNQIKSEMLNIQPNLSVGQAEAMLRRWFVEDKGTTAVS
jgi:acetyl-CoA carboxylase/biotin carboxylase 1